MYHWNEWDVYRFYNAGHRDYPDLPPPPNPIGLQTFMMACLDVTIKQLNEESNPKSKNASAQRRGNRGA